MEKINLKQILLWDQQKSGLINKFREFGALQQQGEIKCCRCGEEMHLWHDNKKDEWFWLYKKSILGHAERIKQCNNKKSIKAKSIFEGTHLSFEQIMIYIHGWTQYSEIPKISIEADISSRTASNYNKFCTEDHDQCMFC